MALVAHRRTSRFCREDWAAASVGALHSLSFSRARSFESSASSTSAVSSVLFGHEETVAIVRVTSSARARIVTTSIFPIRS